MRQLVRGVLATLVLLLSACGANQGPNASTASAQPVGETALASASKISTPDSEPRASAAALTILVTSPEGIDAPGLDAAVSVLAGRPDTAVLVTAPAADARATPDGHAATALAAVESTTMTGHPASVVNGSMLDALDTITAPDAVRPDLVVIGLIDDAGPESAAMLSARVAVGRGIPVLVVTVEGSDPDLAGAGMLLATIADYELDVLLEEPAVHVLTVPACEKGIVRGPDLVDAASEGELLPIVDCTDPDTGPFADEIDAWTAGHATLARRP